jgi:hypothetical protein
LQSGGYLPGGPGGPGGDSRWQRLLESGALIRAGAWCVSALVVCVCVARVDCLLRHPPCLTAHGERTWLGWAYRHPEPEEIFQRIEDRLRPGEPIVVVARQAEEETYWWRTMGAYFMPDHPIAALKDLAPGSGLPPAVGTAQVIVSPGERQIRVLRAPG